MVCWTAQIYARGLLEPGHEISGPAVIEQLDTTTVIHPEQQATVDDYRNLIVKEKEIGMRQTRLHETIETFERLEPR